LATK